MRLAGCIVAVILLCGSAWAKPTVRPEKGAGERRPIFSRQNLDCSSATPIRIGDFVSGDNTGAPTNVSAYSCYPTWNESGGEVVFELTVEGPGCRIVGISVIHECSVCDLDFWILGSCDEADCLYYHSFGALFNCLDPGTYYVVVDGYEGDECPFTLLVVDSEPPKDCCPLVSICHEFDFDLSNGGFTTTSCGGVPVWEWGPCSLDPTVNCSDEPVTNVLGTILDDDTPDYAREVALLGPVSITSECSCMEICHYYDTEYSYDGGNVKASTDGGSTWDLLVPSSHYDAREEFLDLFTACVKGELAYSDGDQPFQFRTDCFDLSGYAGGDVLIGFFFGSDASWNAPGWYISSVKIGNSGSPVEHLSWGTIKALYR